MSNPVFAPIVRLFQSGQIALAETHCRSLVAANPRHPQANHLLGVILLQTGRVSEAIDVLQAAVKALPSNYEALSILAKALSASGQHDRAHSCFEKVARAKPNDAQFQADLGLSFSYLGKHEEARRVFAKSLAKDSRNLSALLGMGQALANLGQIDKAASFFSDADRLYPGRTDTLEFLAKAQLALRQFDDAMRVADRALAVDPKSRARLIFAHVHYLHDRFETAEEELRRTLSCHPDDFEARLLLAILLRRIGKLDEAFSLFQRLVAESPSARFNFGLCLKDMGRLDEAILEVETALRHLPPSADLIHARSLLYLQAGRLEEGWRDHAARFHTSVEPVLTPTLSMPALQQTDDLSNHTVLVWAEQSIGAQISFCSALSDLTARVGSVELLSFPKLKSLFARSFPKVRVIESATQSCATRHMPAGDLFAMFRQRIEDFTKTPSPYLVPDADKVEGNRARLQALGPGLKVGIGWRSTSVNLERQKHFFASLMTWGPILSRTDVTFINLQPKCGVQELEDARSRFGCRIESLDDIDLFDDLDSTAALISALDLVISNGSANAFLAAALGTPVWMFYVAHAHWDLLGANDRIPWLPSLVPVQRRWNEDWDDAIARMAQALDSSRKAGALISPASLPEDVS